jgi:hypothetical protein
MLVGICADTSDPRIGESDTFLGDVMISKTIVQ